jgi:hypothetical protein
MGGMSWLEILAVVVVGFLVLKFIFKPLFKLLALAALALIAWLLLMN